MKNCLSAIYAIVCLIDQYRYIGATTRLDKRQNEHLAALANGSHHNRNLQAAYNQHGANLFVFVILEKVEDLSKLAEREKDAVARAKRAGIAYNIKVSGGNPGGYKLSDETRSKQSKAKQGRAKPEGFGAKIAELTKKEYRFISPAGEVVEVRGLKQFAKERGLSAGNLSRVWNGHIRQYKGWRRG